MLRSAAICKSPRIPQNRYVALYVEKKRARKGEVFKKKGEVAYDVDTLPVRADCAEKFRAGFHLPPLFGEEEEHAACMRSLGREYEPSQWREFTFECISKLGLAPS